MSKLRVEILVVTPTKWTLLRALIGGERSCSRSMSKTGCRKILLILAELALVSGSLLLVVNTEDVSYFKSKLSNPILNSYEEKC